MQNFEKIESTSSEETLLPVISPNCSNASLRTDEATLRDQMKEEATNRVSYRLVIDQVVKDEKISVSDKDIDKEAKEMAKKYNMEVDEFVAAFGGKEFIKYDMEVKKALELIQK